MSDKQTADKPTVEQVKEHIDDDTLEAAHDAGVDTDSTIQSTIDERAGYSAATVARFAANAMDTKSSVSDTETINGLLSGSRDRYGQNWPRRFSLVRSNGEHMEVSAWDSTVQSTDGGEITLETPAKVSLACEYQDEYDDYQVQAVESYTPVDEYSGLLSEVADPPSSISRSDEYEAVCITGEIAFVDPQTVFEDGEPAGDGPVVLPDDRDPPVNRPHFEFALSKVDSVQVRGHLERQRYGEPYVDLPELDMLLEDAAAHDSPEAQADFLQTALRGIEVYLVGTVSSVDKHRGDDGESTTYVDVAATAVVQSGSSDYQVESTEVTTESTQEPADVADDIQTAANLQGADPSSLTFADVESMAPALVDEHPKDVIEHALRTLGGDAPRSDGSEDTALEPPDLTDDPKTATEYLEHIRDGGTIGCPADSCLVEHSEPSAMLGHIKDEHAPDEIANWVWNRL